MLGSEVSEASDVPNTAVIRPMMSISMVTAGVGVFELGVGLAGADDTFGGVDGAGPDGAGVGVGVGLGAGAGVGAGAGGGGAGAAAPWQKTTAT